MTNDQLTILLYFYSAMAQSMASLIVVGGVFAIFRIQEINQQLSRNYKAFKKFINYYFIDPVSRKYKVRPPYVDPDTEMWLDKDVFTHVLEITRREIETEWQKVGGGVKAKKEDTKAGNPGVDLVPGLLDYWNDIHNQLIFKINIKREIKTPTLIMAMLFVASISMLFLLFQCPGINLLPVYMITVFIILWVMVVMIFIVDFILVSMKGPKREYFNNALVNSRSEERQKILVNKQIEFTKCNNAFWDGKKNLSDYV